MLKIYHNARCSKSREGLEILEKSGREYEVIEYLKEPLSENELEQLVKKLDIAPIQLVRKNEKVWKENYKDKDLSDRELITVMVKNPKLIERPVVETERKAVIGRPPSDIEKLL
ncbi:arsenate reductase (glutaredoxin) [Christiangramia sabulilitoris]|uniref:Arsenate reductase (Glutaredoxin) n=1 Tax=Christiangramia sabulilitoris TaxID=2583991 RepID=A0A550I5R9_9FLAO|nr:arsenate reductase (glutaredoxin) [Christiangramia sabulilitoris]TRO66334.1 arsenate reductase (glutaredoxin) [Christiangramia sabulilitoris]